MSRWSATEQRVMSDQEAYAFRRKKYGVGLGPGERVIPARTFSVRPRFGDEGQSGTVVGFEVLAAVAYEDGEARRALKARGYRWDPNAKNWWLAAGTIPAAREESGWLLAQGFGLRLEARGVRTAAFDPHRFYAEVFTPEQLAAGWYAYQEDTWYGIIRARRDA